MVIVRLTDVQSPFLLCALYAYRHLGSFRSKRNPSQRRVSVRIVPGGQSYDRYVSKYILYFVYRATQYIRFKKIQLDAHFIFSIFRQTPLHVSGVSIAHHLEVRRVDTTISTNCCIHKVYLLMMGYRYARNM